MFILHVESGDEIDNFFFIFDRMDPPIIDDEFQLRYLSVAFSNFGIFVERLSHDSNQHVQQMDAHEQTKQEEKNFQDNGHFVLSIFSGV